MDLLDRLLGHDIWTTRQLLVLCSELTDEQLDQRIDIAHQTVRATFEHMIRNVEIWSGLMAGEPMGLGQEGGRRGRSTADLITRHELSAARLTRIARTIAARGGWDDRWLDSLDNPPTEKTYGSAIAHVLTHNMHHRAQLLYMLRMLGIRELPEGDVFSWERHAEASKLRAV